MNIDWETRRAKILFVDFGNTEKKKLSELYELDDEMYKYPFQAIECKLAGIKPDLIVNPIGVWTRESTKKFARLIETNDPIKSRYSRRMKINIVDIEDETVVMCKLYACNKDTNLWEDVGDVLTEPDANGLAVAMQVSQTEQSIDVVRSSFHVPASATNRYYVPNRESGYMSRRPDFAKIDAELKKVKSMHTVRIIIKYKTKIKLAFILNEFRWNKLNSENFRQ